jgi:hypothetical protein
VYFYITNTVFTNPIVSETADNADGPPHFRRVYAVEYPMLTQDNYNYSLSPVHISSMLHMINSLPAVRMRFTVHTRSLDNEPMRLSSTALINVAALNPQGDGAEAITSFTIPGNTRDIFVLQRHRASPRVPLSAIHFHTVQWRSEHHILQRLISNAPPLLQQHPSSSDAAAVERAGTWI